MQIRSALLTFVAAIGILAQAGAVASEPADVAKTTYLLIYRPGPAWPQGKPVSELPLRDHGKYMLSLYAKGLMKRRARSRTMPAVLLFWMFLMRPRLERS
jgi:hypothetical protein